MEQLRNPISHYEFFPRDTKLSLSNRRYSIAAHQRIINVDNQRENEDDMQHLFDIDVQGENEHIRQLYNLWVDTYSSIYGDKLEAGLVTDDESDAWWGSAISPRQQQLLYRLTAGWSNNAIAEAFGVTHHTVKNYITQIGKILTPESEVTSSSQLIVRSLELGVVDPSIITTNRNCLTPIALTDAERNIFDLLVEPGVAYTNREIAERVFVSEQGVKNQITGILRKYGFQNRDQIRIDEIKRRLALAELDVDDMDLSHTDQMLILLLRADWFGGSRNGFSLGNRDTSRELEITKNKFGALTELQMLAHATHARVFPRRDIAQNAVFQAAEELADDDLRFLVRIGTIPDKFPISKRAQRLKGSSIDNNARLKSLVGQLGAEDGIQAAVVAMAVDAGKKYPVGEFNLRSLQQAA